eukprot:NODE_6607_length_499_cov_127.086667_g5822_i0.p1 GENE.NODE_6607_length_499_cov_127.086667_g5822_i0~~NODE_6607_length_499_cov_127.086667_g5822_i0.p1  ORF type:complete len:122 (-),score=16.08 NODE_6607_length_499_cov_127.086667_g5822_i0:132-443(-)
MGRVKTKTVKRAARAVIEKYYGKLTTDFHTNKRILDDVAVIQSKRLRNKIAGYSSHLMKRIQKGPSEESPSACRKRKEKDAWISSPRSRSSSSTTSAPETRTL